MIGPAFIIQTATPQGACPLPIVTPSPTSSKNQIRTSHSIEKDTSSTVSGTRAFLGLARIGQGRERLVSSKGSAVDRTRTLKSPSNIMWSTATLASSSQLNKSEKGSSGGTVGCDRGEIAASHQHTPWNAEQFPLHKQADNLV
jgi:hypothetical protein